MGLLIWLRLELELCSSEGGFSGKSRCVGAAHHWPQDSGFASAAPYGIGKGGDLQMQARFAARCPPDHVRLMPCFQV
ncbi:hypothetical protein F0562_013363 [Nyssa sinensis]|uniref:Uncharacterized protein n=1 Tax=Nyssa sinensis TaxID=561372 RepID=A0A5J4ZPQ7_9ASTE|nr:hypothetical protein F0562_013363 [Nyssa sinensis]